CDCFIIFFFFFFQAEDGIRDGHVTGVQTCALPIFGRNGAHPHGRTRGGTAAPRLRGGGSSDRGRGFERNDLGAGGSGRGARHLRSEERRVGKECRCRWEGETGVKK